LHRALARVQLQLQRSTQTADPFIATAAAIAVVGEPLFWAVWSYLIPQDVDDLGLRLAISALCAPLVFHRRWPQALTPWLPAYWHLAVLLTVPAHFALMLIANAYSLTWLLTTVSGAVLLSVLMPWHIAFITFVLGTTAAALSASWLLNQPNALHWPRPEVLTVYLFCLVVTGMVNLRLQQARSVQLRAERHLRELAQTNTELLRERHDLLANFLNNSLLERLRVLESTVGLRKALALMTEQQNRFCALLQADIRSFTKLVDAHNESAVAQLVSQCYTEITSVGQDLSVIKPIGDCIFLYSDIDQAREEAVLNVFCLAAIFVASVHAVNETSAKALNLPPLNVGLGLHAGDVIYGNLSSPTLVDPTVLGVNVNLTARLEQLTKAAPVAARIGPNGMLMSEEFVWLLRKSGLSLPGMLVLDLGELAAPVRDFANVTRLYGLTEAQALSFAPQARERIRLARLARAGATARTRLQTDPGSHRGVPYQVQMRGAGPNLSWSIFLDVSRWHTQRVHAALRHLPPGVTHTQSQGDERWLEIVTQSGDLDENDVHAIAAALIDRLRD
jgi:class 3 adenylate cyclase